MDRCYGFSRYRVMLHADDALPCAWIDNYLAPFFRVAAEGACCDAGQRIAQEETDASWTVHAEISESQIEECKRAFDEQKAAGRVVEFPELATSYAIVGEGFLVRQSDPDTLVAESWLRIVPGSRMVSLYISPGNPEAPYVVSRAVRAIIVGQALADGWSTLHASCVQVDGCGLLTVGSKGAGKTALMMALVTQRHGKYVSNDKLLAKRIDGMLRVQGLPHSPAVKLDMLERYGLADVQTSYVFQGTSTKRRFLVDELCRALGTTVSPQTSVRAILLSHYRAEAAGACNPEAPERAISRGVHPGGQALVDLEAAQTNTICEFQPIWKRVFGIDESVRTAWWSGTEIVQFDYSNSSLPAIAQEL